MKRNFFLPLISGAIIIFLSAASVIEPTGEYAYTGSPVDGGLTNGTCGTSGCHSGGATIPTLSLSANPAFGGSGTALTYSAGITYTISVIPGGSYASYGFNCEIINSQSATKTAVAMFGAFGAAVSSNCKIYTASQTSGWPPTASHNTPSTSAFSFVWTAPASGTGFLYADVNGVNLDGNTSGDHVSAITTITLTAASSAGIANVNQSSDVNLTVFPNPATDHVIVGFGTLLGTKTVQLYDVTGKMVAEKNTEDATAQLDLTSIAKGTYFVKVLNDTKTVIAVKMIMLSK